MPSISKEEFVRLCFWASQTVMCEWVPGLVKMQILIQQVWAGPELRASPGIPGRAAGAAGLRPTLWSRPQTSSRSRRKQAEGLVWTVLGHFLDTGFPVEDPALSPHGHSQASLKSATLPRGHLWKHIGNRLAREDNVSWDTWPAHSCPP